MRVNRASIFDRPTFHVSTFTFFSRNTFRAPFHGSFPQSMISTPRSFFIRAKGARDGRWRQYVNEISSSSSSDGRNSRLSMLRISQNANPSREVNCSTAWTFEKRPPTNPRYLNFSADKAFNISGLFNRTRSRPTKLFSCAIWSITPLHRWTAPVVPNKGTKTRKTPSSQGTQQSVSNSEKRHPLQFLPCPHIFGEILDPQAGHPGAPPRVCNREGKEPRGFDNLSGFLVVLQKAANRVPPLTPSYRTFSGNRTDSEKTNVRFDSSSSTSDIPTSSVSIHLSLRWYGS